MAESRREDIPRVSVLLPARNAASHLTEALDSILGQSLADLECLVVDDGSTDGTAALLAARAARDPRLRVLAGGGGGVARALALGLDAARGEFVAIMNADDVSLPGRLARQVAYLDEHPGVAAVGGQTRLLLGEGRGGRPGRVSDLPTRPADVRRMLPIAAPLAHPAAMVRRAAALAAGGYRAAFRAAAEDYDLWLRLAEHHDLANLPDVVLLYRVHDRQATAGDHLAAAAATLAARGSAGARRAGRPDPLDGEDAIDERLLTALGIPADAVARQAIACAVDRGETLLAAGADPTAAGAALDGLSGDPLVARQRTLLAAAKAWLRGRVLLATGRPVAGIGQLLGALREPGFRSRFVGVPARRFSAWWRGGAS